CLDTLPVRAFFRVDVATGVAVATPGANASSATLVEIARRDARAAQRPAIHVTTAKTLGDAAAITYVQYDSANRAQTVFGLIAPARAVGSALFADADRATTVVDLGERMVTLDSVSLLVAGPD